jgi:hypothetical protein
MNRLLVDSVTNDTKEPNNVEQRQNHTVIARVTDLTFLRRCLWCAFTHVETTKYLRPLFLGHSAFLCRYDSWIHGSLFLWSVMTSSEDYSVRCAANAFNPNADMRRLYVSWAQESAFHIVAVSFGIILRIVGIHSTFTHVETTKYLRPLFLGHSVFLCRHDSWFFVPLIVDDVLRENYSVRCAF